MLQLLKTFFSRLYRSTMHALRGFKFAFQSEFSFRLELFFSFLFIPLAFYLGQTAFECLFLTGTWLLVLVAELFNSAIEVVVDRIGSEHHPLSGQAKDIAASTVLLSLAFMVISWITLLLTH